MQLLPAHAPNLPSCLHAGAGWCGWLADRLGRKRVFIAGLVLFTVAGVVAAYADSVTQLILARGAMGIGEALMMPATLAIIGTVFTDPAERTKAIGIWSASGGVGTVIGPMLGGRLLDHFWWGSVFLVNLPVGVAGLAAAVLLVPAVPAARGRRLDLLGASLSIAGPALLLWALIEGPADGWTDPVVPAVFAAAAVLVSAFVRWERHAPVPLLPLGTFRHRGLAVGAVLILLGAFAMIGTLFVLVQHLQFDLGYTGAQTGWRLDPMALALLVAGPVVVFVLLGAGAWSSSPSPPTPLWARSRSATWVSGRRPTAPPFSPAPPSVSRSRAACWPADTATNSARAP